MRYALTAEESRALEERAVAAQGITLGQLMERAGAALAAVTDEVAPPGRVVVLAGPGNNGGDGWVAARLLTQAGRTVRVFCVRHPDEVDGIAGDAAREAVAAGVAYEVTTGALRDADLAEAAAVVDAILGTGSTGALRDPFEQWVDVANASAAVIVAADIPTGIATDTGVVDGAVIDASYTVAFSAPKRAHMLFPGAGHTGELIVADIGIDPDILDAHGSLEIWSAEEYAEALPMPPVDTYKYARGEVLVVAGSRAYAGAAVLAARGAQRMGAGYVRLAAPDSVREIAQTVAPSVVTHAMPSDLDGFLAAGAAPLVVELAESADAVVVGPGLGAHDGTLAVVEALLATDRPLVIDADALTSLAGRTGDLAARDGVTIITPHAGEMGRLLGIEADEVQRDRVAVARRLAAGNTVVVLKGAGTIVADGTRTVVIGSATQALATAGTGDVLAGMIGAVLAANPSGLEAAAVAAAVHGRAGELAAAEVGPMSVIAEDVPAFVGAAVHDLLASAVEEEDEA